MENLLKVVIKKYKRVDLANLFAIISLIIVFFGMTLTFFFATSAKDRHQRDFNVRLEQQSENFSTYISNGLMAYRQILYSSAGIFDIKGYNNVSRSDWQKFYESSKIADNYPGVVALGYAEYIPKDNLNQFIDNVRQQGYPQFNINPSTERLDYTSIKFIEPFDAVNQPAFGYDMYSEPLRHTAMLSARDKGDISITDPTVLVQDSDLKTTDKPQSVLIYYPVYKTTRVPDSVPQKREQLAGYVYLAVRIQDMIKTKIATLQTEKINYQLSDIGNRQALDFFRYSTAGYTPGKNSSTNNQTVYFGDHTWKSSLTMEDNGKFFSPIIIFIFGVLSSILVGIISFGLLTKRILKIKSQHQKEIQKTKDELLALASHQLRTPASGVRQYLNMLNSGYFGELTDEQKDIAQKAFDANDRQLEIIDQLLYVAKADAGQLSLTPHDYNLTDSIKELVESMKSTADKKKIELKLKAPQKLQINADKRYIDMVIENLISNSIKYSYPYSKVDIDIKKIDRSIQIIVKDRGVGIAKVDHDKLFKKFSRISNPLSISEGGSGLGLYLVQKLVRAHGGSINYVSNGKKGVVFTIRLPLRVRKGKNVIQLTE